MLVCLMGMDKNFPLAALPPLHCPPAEIVFVSFPLTKELQAQQLQSSHSMSQSGNGQDDTAFVHTHALVSY